jgi:hypothetical chaperone protein
MARACGMDFGTSNSTVGLVRPGQPLLLTLEDGKPTLPSVVFFNAEEETAYYGRAALTNYLAGYEGRLMRSLKSLLGTSLIDSQTEVHGRALPYRGLLAQFIGELKRRAEAVSGQALSSAVIGRPVFFIDDNPKADALAQQTLEEVARAAGFKEIAFQFEPIAAAFDYESQIDKEELVLIADIGGGTSDFSLVRLSPQRAKQSDRRDDILGTGGVHIGGTDFDKYLSLECMMPLLGLGTRMQNGSEVPSSYYFNLATWHTINLVYTQKVWLELKDVVRDVREKDKFNRLLNLVEERAGHWLAMQVEETKIALSDTPQIDIRLERLRDAQTMTIHRTQFDDAIAHLVGNIESTVGNVLRDAGVAADAIDTVFFTGGSSGVQSLREKIAALLPNARRVEGDLFGSIGAGLALDAQRKFG